MRKNDDDWVKKCVEYRVKDRRPVGRPRRTWLEGVEADMAKLQIDSEDVHDGRNGEKIYEEEVQPYRKTDYKRIL